MNNRTVTSMSLAVIGLFALALQLRGDTEDSIKKTLTVSAGGKLTMKVDRGSIEVKGASSDNVQIDVIRVVSDESEGKAREILRDHQVTFSQDGKDVKVEARLNDDSGLFGGRKGRHLKVRYVVTVPKVYQVDLHTAGGSISVAELDGEVQCRTSGGNLKIGDVTGPVLAKTGGGSITVEACKGQADVQTSGGNLKISSVEGNLSAKTSGGSISVAKAGGNVVAQTSGGSIDIQDVRGTVEASTSGGSVRAGFSQQPKGNCSLKTSGGNIDVKLADKLAFDLDAHSSGGRVVADFPVTVQGELRRSHLQTKINGGGPTLLLHTSGGSVRIGKM